MTRYRTGYVPHFEWLRECANRSGSAAGSGVPAVEAPGPAQESADQDDGVGQGDVEVGDDLSAFGASGQFVEVVVPGVGAFDRPTFGGLDRCGQPLVRDGTLQSPLGQQRPGDAGVVAGVEVDARGLRQWAQVFE